MTREERVILLAAGALALGIPLAAWGHMASRTGELEAAASEACGMAVRVGAIEAGLTGAVRLRGVAVGDLVAADAVEAAVALPRLLDGDFGVDEIRVEGPHLALAVDGDGDSNLARLVRRVAARRAARGAAGATDGGARRLRRILVSGGDLVADVALPAPTGSEASRLRLHVRGLELHPHEGGVRLVTGAAWMTARRGPWAVQGGFARSAADLDLAGTRLGRLLAVGGRLTITSTLAPPASAASASAASAPPATATLRLVEATLARSDRTASLALDARIDLPGSPHLSLSASGGDALTISGAGVGVPLAVLAPLLPAGVDLTEAEATGRVALSFRGAATGIDLDAAVTGLRLDHRRVAADPVPLHGHAALRARLWRADRGSATAVRVLDADSLDITVDGLHLLGRGRVELAGLRPMRGDVSLELPATSCQDAIASLPEPLRAGILGLALRGRFAASVHLAFDADALDPAAAARLDADLGFDRCAIVADAVAADPRLLLRPFDHTFPDGSRRVVGAGEEGWVALAALPGHVAGAFVAAEDARFFLHHGFDLIQIGRSLGVNIAAGALLRGGSTISQQTVKNAFLSPDRSLARKLQEAILTWRLEAVLDKRTILERYLNLIELGPGIYGLDAGARHWFDKPPQRLSVAEAAFLAALTPEPQSWARRIAAAGGIDPQSRERIEVVLRAMRRSGVIDTLTYDAARHARLRLASSAIASR